MLKVTEMISFKQASFYFLDTYIMIVAVRYMKGKEFVRTTNLHIRCYDKAFITVNAFSI